MNKIMIEERIIRLNDLIEMLKGDIADFGPTSEDLSRLTKYKEELKTFTNLLGKENE